MVSASAPGKIILFGEHFVVYGLPAIAAAIDARTIAKVEKSSRFQLIDERLETPGYKKEKLEQQTDSIQRIFRAMGVEGSKMKITLAGDLIAASGVGASAASCSAIAAAINAEFDLGFDLKKINEIAFEGEKGYHGTPSGIDNSCSTFGGFIWFEKDPSSGKAIIRPLDSNVSFSIVVGNTGITSNTTKVVDEVRRHVERNPVKFEKIFNQYRELVTKAKVALQEKDLREVGWLMDMNQSLLSEIGVSSNELDKLIEISRKSGAIGAKLTGTGRGGLMIAMVTIDTGKKVASAIERTGYKSEITDIGAEGVKVI